MLKKRDFIKTTDWSTQELETIIQLAGEMKRNPTDKRWASSLDGKTFLLLFHNPSLRTHLSFETAVLQLGGHTHFRTPSMGWIKTTNKATTGESLKDAAKVMSRYVDGIGVRITLDAISHYGMGHQILCDYAKWTDVPVINMADDTYHPCQGLADLMGWSEWYGEERGKPDLNQLKGKKLLLTWGKSGLARPWCSVQSHMLLAARFGMDVTVAYPEGYDLDPSITKQAQEYCQDNNATFDIVNDPDVGYEKAHVVYARNWISKDAYKESKLNYEQEVEKALSHKNWTTTLERMNRTNNAIFANPMPVDRNHEAMDDVVDSENSVIYEVAENRVHIQKAILATLMGM